MIFLWWLTDHQRWRNTAGLEPVLLQPSVLHVGKLSCSSRDLHPCFYITFFPSPQHKPKPGTLRRTVVTPPHFLCSFLRPRQSSERLHPQSFSPTLFPATRSVSTDHSLLAGRVIHFSHVTTPTTAGSQLLCLGYLNSNSMQKLGNCLLVLNTKSRKREYYWSKLCQLSISGPTTCGHRVGKEVT